MRIILTIISISILCISGYAKKVEVTLAPISMMNNLVTIKIPTHFSALLDFENKKYYDGKKSLKIAYGDSLREVRLAFYLENYNDMKDPGLGAMKADVLNKLLKDDLKLKELSNGIGTVDGREMAYFGILHKSPEKFYRFYFLTLYNKLVLAGELICPKKVYKSWIPVGEEIMNSLDVK